MEKFSKGKAGKGAAKQCDGEGRTSSGLFEATFP